MTPRTGPGVQSVIRIGIAIKKQSATRPVPFGRSTPWTSGWKTVPGRRESAKMDSTARLLIVRRPQVRELV